MAYEYRRVCRSGLRVFGKRSHNHGFKRRRDAQLCRERRRRFSQVLGDHSRRRRRSEGAHADQHLVHHSRQTIDIGTRIQRYRLSRYGSPAGPLLRRLRWALPLLGLWLVYITLLSDHSLLRMWRLGRDGVGMRRELEVTRKELVRIETEMKDPAARRRQAEQLIREKSGFAKPKELIYRIPEPDSTAK